MVKGATVAIGIQSIMNDTGVNLGAPIRLHSDASAAICIASRIGIGKVRHIDVTHLLLQERVSEEHIEICEGQHR